MSMNKIWYLKKCDLFHSLKKEALERIAVIANEKNVPKKQVVMSADGQDDIMYVLKKGTVRVFKLSSEGKMITLDILKDGDIFGAMSVVKGGTTGAYAETLEDSYICAIRQEDLTTVIKEMPDLAVSLIGKINQKLTEAEDRIADLVFRDVPGRIASVLLKLAEQFGKVGDKGVEISIKLTHQELADMVGSSRETVTIVLNEFKEDGVVSISEKHISIIDEKRLKTWAGKEIA
jgi:CRP/FNR family cyclic AMP-dependent transcriptional regulator